jgi:iron(III) transport system permease protein
MVWFGCALYSVPAILGTGSGIEMLTPRIVHDLAFTFPPKTGVAVGLSFFVVLAVGTAYVMQRRILSRGRHVTVGGKGNRVTRIRLGRWRWPARALLLGYVVVAAVLPMIALALVALNGFWTPQINWGGLDLDAFRQALVQDEQTRQAIVNSVLLGVGGATIALLGAAVVALFVQRTSGRISTLIDSAIKLPAAISTIVVAVGVVLTFSGPPFNLGGTLAILLIAYIALYMPQGAVAADAAAGQVGRDLPEASWVSGAGSGRTFRRVYVPIMLPGLIAGWALLFVRMTGDLSASAMLSGTSNPVVGARILQVYNAGSYPLLASLAVVLTLITGVVLAVVMTTTRKRAHISAGAET